MRNVLQALYLASVFGAAAGCGQQGATVAGKVTYNGEPVKMGAISFRPSDGMGQVFAGQIADGDYQIRNAVPGKRTVAIRGTKEVNFGRSSEEAIRLSEEAAKKGHAWAGHVAEPADYIPENAEGNNQTVDIQPGDQTMNFDLKGPPAK